MKYIKLWLVLLLDLLLVCGGCGQEKQPTAFSDKDIIVVDSTGTKLAINEKPQRVISLSISTDEIILDLLPPERIAGITKLADQPSISNVVDKAKKIPNRVYGNSPESLLKLKPDLIILPDFIKPEVITTLRDFGLKVYVYKTQKNIDEVRKIIRDIGKLVGEEQKAQVLIDGMNQRLAKIQSRLKDIPEDKQKRIIYIRSNGAYYMKESSFHDICRYAAAKDATIDLKLDQAGPVGKEQIVLLNPDAFIVVDYNYDGRHAAAIHVKEILSDPAYHNTKAYKNKEIYVLPGNHMLGLAHYIAYGVEDMAKVLYPERFEKTEEK